MTGQHGRRGPPPGTVPVVVNGDVLMVDSAGLAVQAGAVTVYPEGFAVTLRVLSDPRGAGPPPAPWALDVAERVRMTWLEVRYPDGRVRAADLNANTPRRQPRGPCVQAVDASASDGCDISRWWVTPLPPPGPVELAIHLNGEKTPTGVGSLDGAALLRAAARAQVIWPQPQEGGPGHAREDRA